MGIRYGMRAFCTPGRPDELKVVSFDILGVDDPVPLLDEAQDPTVESIQQATTAEELRTAMLKCQEMPMTSVHRAAMEAAIRRRAEDLNISTYDFIPRDGGAMMQAAQAMQDDWISGVVAVLDDVQGKPLRIRLKGSESNVVSLNRRVYLHEILTDAVTEVATRARGKQATYGEDGHPPMDVTDSQGRPRFRRTRQNAVLVPENVFMQGTEVLVDARILEDTESGRALAADIRAGRPVFFSTRAYGYDMRVAKLTDGSEVKVPMRMEIETWDRVRNPAFPDAKPLAVLDAAEVEAICDAVQLPARAPAAPAATKPTKGDTIMTLEMIRALAQTEAGRRQLALHLTTAGLTDEVRTAITDALATPLPIAAPAAVTPPQGGTGAVPPAAQPSQAVIDEAVTAALNKAEEAARKKADEAARARTEAKEFVTAEVKKLRDGNRFPTPLIDSIEKALADVPNKAAAEAQLQERIAMADSIMPAMHLVSLGYGAVPGQAQALHVQVRENQTWKPIVDSLMAAFDDFRLTAFGERPDAELRKVNQPFLDKVLAKFDAINARGLLDAAAAWNGMTDSITTTDLWNQPVVQRAMLMQAFGDADMLQFIGTDVFEGDTMLIPVEYYEGSGSQNHRSGEMQPMARGKIKTAWIPVTANPRRILAEISNDVQRGMASGPLRYNASARALYHVMAEVRRGINIEGGNEMLRASDAYGAVAVADETVAAGELAAVNDATNVGYQITLRRGGNTGALAATNTDRPVVRPRNYTSFAANGQATKVVENAFTVTVNNVAVPMRDLRNNGDGTVSIVDATGSEAAGFAVDFENGYVYVSSDYTINPGVADCVIDYSYATNFVTFSLTPANGVDEADHYNGLIRLIGFQAALMAGYPRYMGPNVALGSLTAMEYVADASLFYQGNSPKGTILNPGTNNFVGSRNGVDYAKHNTQWAAGDARILLGRAMATKYAVRDPLTPKGPYPIMDPKTGLALPGEQWYIEGFDALLTPEVRNQDGKTLNPYFRTIKLKA